MQTINERIHWFSWMEITDSMHEKGFASVTSLLSREERDSLRETFSNDSLFLKTTRTTFGIIFHDAKS